MNERKNAIQSTGNRGDHIEEIINDLEKKNIEIIQLEEDRKVAFFLSEETLEELSDSIRKVNIRIMCKKKTGRRGREFI